MPWQFQAMKDLIPEGELDGVRVEHTEVTQKDSDFTRLREICGHPGTWIPPGHYVRLLMGGGVMMSDTQHEQRTNYEAVQQARGQVLIAGLGLGMILVPILQKPEVKAVTVVEKSAAVVELVGRRGKFPNSDKLNVVLGDIFEWKPPLGAKYDIIYFDIWPDICADNLKEITQLKRRFTRRLVRPGGWMGAWVEKQLRREYGK